MGFKKWHFKDLKEVLIKYKIEVDTILKENAVNENLKEYYSEEYFNQLKATAKAKAKRSIDSKRSEAQNKVKSIISSLKDDVSEWINAPIDTNFLNKLQTIKATGVKLTNTELELLAEQTAGQYLPLKILSEIAMENHYIVDAPSVDLYFNELKKIEDGSSYLLNYYCGGDLTGYDLIPNNFVDGIDYGKQPLYMCVNADCILHSDSVIDKAESHWGQTMVHVRKKDSLTSSETDYLKSFYEGYENDVASRTKDLVKVNPGLKELIGLSEYKEHLPATD